MDELGPALCANLCCLGMFVSMAGGTWGAAHVRMKRAEADGSPAMRTEHRLFLYAGASVLWLVAAVLAVVMAFRRNGARAARDCLGIFWAHMGATTLVACVAATAQAARLDAELLITAAVGAVVAASAIGVVVFGWRGSTERMRRIQALPATGPAMGNERFAYYLGAAAVAFAGPVAAYLLREPQNVEVGTRALRISLVQFATILIATMAGIVLLVAIMGPL